MFLVRLPDDHPVQWLFLHSDPRLEGCKFPVEEGVEYDDDAGKDATDPECAVLMQAKSDPKKYKRCLNDCVDQHPSYHSLEGMAMELTSWTNYAATRQKPFSVMLNSREPSLRRRAQ